MKKKVLILAGYYYPSVKAGGPVQSIKNLVDLLGDECEFYIIANDRDLGDANPFSHIKLNQWENVDKAKVYYTNYNNISGNLITKIIKDNNINILYLNSAFNFKLSIVPLLLYKLKRFKVDRIIVAPRGNFSKGALDLKKAKKKYFLTISQKINLFNNVIWHATAESEKMDILNHFGGKANIKIAKNLTADYKNYEYTKHITKKTGSLKLIFLSRIHPKKNLMYALNILKYVDGKVEFEIYGPIEDRTYWEQCKVLIKQLPDNIKVNYKGVVKHDEVLTCFNENHVLLFPTLGENFGHIISEALIGGCPVILSDQTPWRNLKDYKVGFDINLKDTDEFQKSIQYFIDLNDSMYKKISNLSFEYGKEQSASNSNINCYFELFNL